MSGAKGYHRRSRGDRKHDGGQKHKPVVGEKAREVLENIDENSPIIKAFREYSVELDSKHDKYERIVKLSRDITIESKRIIFLLHTLDRESKKEDVIKEAEKRLSVLESTFFRMIADELIGEDPHHYLRAYTAGLQEYVEALTFCSYLKSNSLENWTDIQNKLEYPKSIKKPKLSDQLSDEPVTESGKDTNISDDDKILEESDKNKNGSMKTLISPEDYVLGVADLTGELMRKCINNLGSGNIESCFQTCGFVKEIYNGFLRVGNTGPREFNKKVFTLRQSLTKMENACYTIHVRGSEIPKFMLADVFSDKHDDFMDEDEGFY
ncbi:translin-associated protein X [Anabrus simplex]|uniref:translin-associated protein X n=1 Tax=Anabrus simplex TaxID=316456 RepID=UPI0034DD2A26